MMTGSGIAKTVITDTSHLPQGGAPRTTDVHINTKLNVVSFNSCGFKGSLTRMNTGVI
jgi:hypothetical protein